MKLPFSSYFHWYSSQDVKRNKSGTTPSFVFFVMTLLLFFCLFPRHSMAIRWLGIYRLPKSADHPVDSTAERFSLAECEKAANELGLRRRQMRFCAHPRFGYAMLAVLRAAHAVGYHCPKAFADRRWNCTSVHQLPDVSPELQRGTREQALVHAFASAALLFEIGRYCALNKIRFCSCGDDTGAYALPSYLTGSTMGEPNPFGDKNSALVYESGGVNEQTETHTNRASASSDDDQQTVSRFYWAGCSDNLRVAREYTSAFLGFPNIRVLSVQPTETVTKSSQGNEETAGDRHVRSTLQTDAVDSDEDDSLSSDENAYHSTRSRRNTAYDWNTPMNSPETINYMLPNIPSPEAHSSPHTVVGRQTSMGYDPWANRPRTRQKRKRGSIIRVLNRHNYLAGVILMEANQRLVCKCHGVSGSCAQRVCFRQLRRIDNDVMQKALKMKYLAAKQVTQGTNGQLIAKKFSGNGFVDEVVKHEELVFSEHSPDYCNVEPQRGSVGTRGRLCTLNDSGTANCINMCCGRGYQNLTTSETVQCNCRMGEGFKVRCDECNVEIVTHRCL
ncbi:Protein Wnt [Fasciola hepatica]|uniref:Protein Wnt n=1 Tax=Fasciola hepatica TaxID=6192 RepID=A0A4E0RDS4_FASHE|nr:Protein Wnt [Fasciola hepatica]